MQNTEHATRRTWRVNVHKNFYRSSFGVKSHPASSGTERDVKLGEEGEGVRVRCLREPARWIQRPAWRGHPRLWPGAFGIASAGGSSTRKVNVATNVAHALVFIGCRVSAFLCLADCLIPSWTPIFTLVGISRISEATETPQPGPTALVLWFANPGSQSAVCAIGGGNNNHANSVCCC